MAFKNIIFVFLTVFAFIKSLPVKNYTNYVFIPDESGALHFVDLDDGIDNKVTVTPGDVTYHLYTKNNVNSGCVITNSNIDELKKCSNYNSKKDNVFIVHGWTNTHTSPVNTETKSAYLKSFDINIFVVDWSGLAAKLYPTAVGAVPQVGIIIGDFINKMISVYKLKSTNFNLIGHSLGAHVAGCAGAQVSKTSGKINYIVGLDPAGPLFSASQTDNRLDPTDGDFVHVVHTNGILLGFSKSIGHADYYPNGGSTQPGCGVDLAGTCAHSRAYYYFAESISSSQFHAVLCDSYKNFKNGNCKNNKKSKMGGLPIDKSAKGDYYLNTNDNKPYAQGPLYKRF